MAPAGKKRTSRTNRQPITGSSPDPIEARRYPAEGYHLTEDLADQAIAWVRTQKGLMPGKPFFMY
ncbi:MAG TPA: hypothetical protein VGD83_34190, partial [Streptosporangiaceae bacterium]